MPLRKHWIIKSYDSELVRSLERRSGISPLIAQLLIGKGIDTPEAVRGFLAGGSNTSPNLSSLRQPEQLPGCLEVAQSLWLAIGKRQRITVYGDYDADGMTGTAILVKAIRQLGGLVDFYVPSRLDEGYGLNGDALKNLAELGTEIVVTVDCGINSMREAEMASSLGIQLMITDHHTPGALLPPAQAIAHPQLLRRAGSWISPYGCDREAFSEGDRYPFPELSGATVALKVAWALGKLAVGTEKVSSVFREFLIEAVGLAAVGTIADVVPLIDENRALVRYGLRVALKTHPPLGVTELMKVIGIDKVDKLSSEDIGFAIAPRLNAAGRLNQASLGIELLVTDNQSRAMELAQFIQNLNGTRQKLERSILIEADRMVREQFDPDDPEESGSPENAAIVLASADWHPGVIGIVAGRVAEQFHRPAVLIALPRMGNFSGNEDGTGSARSIPGFNLYEALEACSEYLVGFGGHKAAAGLRIAEENVAAFREAFCSHAADRISEKQRVAELSIDAEGTLGMCNYGVFQQIEDLAPFGAMNPRPLLCVSGVFLADPPKPMGAEGRHFSVKLVQGPVSIRAYAFNAVAWLKELNEIKKRDRAIDVAFHLTLSKFGNIELHLKDWRPTGEPY